MHFTTATIAAFGLASSVSASPLFARSPLCTPQDKEGFIVKVRSGDDTINGKVLQLAPANLPGKASTMQQVGFDLPNATVVAWPFVDLKARKMYIPGAGYKQNPQAYFDVDTSQLVFYYGGYEKAYSEFGTCCDEKGTFLLCSHNDDIHWQACREEQGWTIRYGLQGNGPCQQIELEMSYGPPTQVPGVTPAPAPAPAPVPAPAPGCQASYKK